MKRVISCLFVVLVVVSCGVLDQNPVKPEEKVVITDPILSPAGFQGDTESYIKERFFKTQGAASFITLDVRDVQVFPDMKTLTNSIVVPGVFIDGDEFGEGAILKIAPEVTGGPVNIYFDGYGFNKFSEKVETFSTFSINDAINALWEANKDYQTNGSLTYKVSSITSVEQAQSLVGFGLDFSDFNNLEKISFSIGSGRGSSSYKYTYLVEVQQVYFSLNIAPVKGSKYYQSLGKYSDSTNPLTVSKINYGRLMYVLINSKQEISQRNLSASLSFFLFSGGTNSAKSSLTSEVDIQLSIYGGQSTVSQTILGNELEGFMKDFASNGTTIGECGALPISYVLSDAYSGDPVDYVYINEYQVTEEFLPKVEYSYQRTGGTFASSDTDFYEVLMKVYSPLIPVKPVKVVVKATGNVVHREEFVVNPGDFFEEQNHFTAEKVYKIRINRHPKKKKSTFGGGATYNTTFYVTPEEFELPGGYTFKNDFVSPSERMKYYMPMEPDFYE